MNFQYRTIRLNPNENLLVPDGDVLAGTTVEPNGFGGFRLVAHILTRVDGVPLTPQASKEAAL